MIKLGKKNNFHFFFIFLILLHYIIPLILLGNITLFYHDVLDAGVVYNHILGKFYNGVTNPFDIFLSGNIQGVYMQNILKPFSLIYSVLNSELAYWTSDLIIKLTSYFAFFLISKKIVKDHFISCLTACLYAYFNANALNGFGTAIFPYLIYICLFKDNLKIKNYLIIFFFGINSDLVSSLIFAPILLIIVYLFNSKLIFKKKLLFVKLISLFYFSMALTSLNLFYIFFFIEEFHRTTFFNERPSFIQNLKEAFFGIFHLPTNTSWSFFKKIPQTILVAPIIIFSLLSKNLKVKNLVILIILYFTIKFFIDLKFFESIKSNLFLFKAYKITWIEIYFPFIHIFLLLLLFKYFEFKKMLVIISFISIFTFQISPSIVPFYKENILKNDEIYKNIYTFSGYYSKDDYNKIKKIVKKDRAMSVGLDPMVAVMNEIKVIDGYHNLYPKKYKIDFRNIIEKELSKKNSIKNYYDHWGNRVYAFISDPKKIDLDFNAAKEIGAKYVISKYVINNEKLIQRCVDCKIEVYLYEIF